MIEDTKGVLVEYINTYIQGEMRAEFRVNGIYKGKHLDELVFIEYKDIKVAKHLEIETKKFQFLAYIKELKDNKDTREVKIKMIELAYKQSYIKENDIEYFKLVYELVHKNNKRSIENKYDVQKGKFVDIRV